MTVTTNLKTKTWTVDVFLSESGRTTDARAALHTGEAPALVAHGKARRNPRDVDVAEIGEEVATARALSALARQLLECAEDDISAVTTVPAHLER